MSCPSCGQENPDIARFCLICGRPLTSAGAIPVRQERKVVSVLFCDLVNFTAASESADPEDVRARLVPYHAMLRDRIESFGGTVEKFVGDAVMAVFGAPTAHEDDPERAVRAGLAILSAIQELNGKAGFDLSVRIGVNTGEVVVALDARPELGEGFVTGDAVNTAARIETAAPIGALAVGEATYQATSRVFAYEPLDPVSVKGKADPVELWRAGAPRARLGADVIRATDNPLVGRDLELLQLRAVFDRVARDSAVHLVTITGEPGVGKSRLVAELAAYVDSLPDLVTWRTGRCLPYGDGVTFWAFGEIVKAHAGILDTDDTDAATAKLDVVLPDGDDKSWLLARLLPLIGVTGDTSGSATSHEESFTAWRRFLEALATTGPAVLLVEDIHWADPALLQFLEHVTTWAHGVPLLIVCTARPELSDTHPTWGSTGLRNSLTLNLSPLSPEDTATVVSHLLGLRLLPAETQQLILQRAEGNPLWAEECVRVLRDRNLIDSQGRLLGSDVPLPQGIQALIAARLDAMPVEHKALLADAAVVGKIFWAGAVSAMGDRDSTQVVLALRDLTARELVRPHREGTFAGQAEYGFWHGLVRDVAYHTLPRTARAAKHLAASKWLAQQAGDRVTDVAEILAEHTSEALKLAQAAGDAPLAEEAAPAVRRYTLLAAEKALPLDAGRAMSLLDAALSVTPPEDGDYPNVLVTWGQAATQVGRLREAADAFQRAADLYRQRRDLMSAGAALAQAAYSLVNLGDGNGRDVLEKALLLLESQQPSIELSLGLLALASIESDSGNNAVALEIIERVEPMVHGDNPELVARFHMTRGLERTRLGDPGGLEEVERGIALCISAGLAHLAATGYYNLAGDCLSAAGPEVALRHLDSGEEFCRSRGLMTAASWLSESRVSCLLKMGRLNEALTLADAILPSFKEAGDDFSLVSAATAKALVLIEMTGSAQEIAAEALQAAHRTAMPQMVIEAQAAAAAAAWAAADVTAAEDLLRRIRDTTEPGKPPAFREDVHRAMRCAVGIGRIDLARDLLSLVQAGPTPLPAQQHALLTARAVLAQAEGDFITAVQLFTTAAHEWERSGRRLEHAHALLGLAESCLAADQDAEQPLRLALDLFRTMGADYRVRQCNERLGDVADAQSAS